MASNANRVNIPAICRIKGRGTAFLISPGLLLTSTHVVGNKSDAAKLSATFFEGTKKSVVEVKLLPNVVYFNAAYPEHLDYCIVACETQGIYGVTPVKVPLVKSEWSAVREGDTVLVVQHPISDDDDGAGPVVAGASDDGIEVKRFEEILRRRDDIFYLKAVGTHRTAGCPVFNDQAELVGMQSQLRTDGEGVVNRVVSIVSVVKHMFANTQLSRIQQNTLFQDVWDTWYVANDTTRIVSIMANFKNKDLQRQAAERLCEHTAKRELLEGVVMCGGTKVIISSMEQFKDDENLACLSMRALWNISFGEQDNHQHITDANGPAMVLNIMELYPKNEDISQFGTVLLFNLSLGKRESADSVSSWASRGMKLILQALLQFPETEVLQKFGVGFLANIAAKDERFGDELVTLGAVAHITSLINNKRHNVFLMENVIKAVALLAASRQRAATMSAIVHAVIDVMLMYSSNSNVLLNGNHALWGLGCVPQNRIAILQHADGAKAFQLSLTSLVASTKLL
jgi:hypothetical protein